MAAALRSRPMALAWWTIRIASWCLLLGVVAILLAVVVVPRVAGGTAYTVLTGSMEPSLPPGELVVVRPIDPADITVGEVVTYQLESGKAATVTHRVVASRVSGSGERSFILQGDANPAADSAPVRPEQLRGALWYHLPLLGFVATWLTGDQRMLGIGLTAGALLLYAAVMWGGAIHRRIHRRTSREEHPDALTTLASRPRHAAARRGAAGRRDPRDRPAGRRARASRRESIP